MVKTGLLMVLMVVIMFSGSDEDVVVSVEISMGSLTKFGSPCVNECVVQYGSRDAWFGGLKGFSRICSDVGVEPK